MDNTLVLSIAKQGLYTAFIVAAPILMTALVVGVCISIFQAATSISDSTLNFAPKVVFSGVILMILGPWMMSKVVSFLVFLIKNIPDFVK